VPNTTITANGRPTLDEAVIALRAAIEPHADLPPAAGTLPPGSLSFDGLKERPVGLGNLRGREAFGPLASISLKGGRLEARLRFELWANDPAAAQAAIDSLQLRLAQAQDALRADGFLKLSLVTTEAAEPVSLGILQTAWRQSTSYEVLYEYRYVDTDGATGLITRIGVASELNADPTTLDTHQVVGAAVRWDNETAPPLRLRGPAQLTRIGALVYLPGTPPGGSVTVSRSFDGAAGAPTVATDLNAFLAAAAQGAAGDPTGRHLQINFPRLVPVPGPPPAEAFLDAFTATGDDVVLGNWEQAMEPPVPDPDLDPYEIHLLDLTPALVLPSRADSLEIIYQPAPFDEIAALYLRGEGSF
jgi:hypothetical protein